MESGGHVGIRSAFDCVVGSGFEIVCVVSLFSHPLHQRLRFFHRDAQRYAALKVCARNDPSAEREVAVYERLDGMTTSNYGGLLIREVYETFRIKGW